MCDFEDDDYGWLGYGRPTSDKKYRKILNDPTKHYPNRDEAKVLRKLKLKTGLSEEEIRANKEYRKMLSDAQKIAEKPKLNEVDRFYLGLIRYACRNTKLPREHPETIKWLQNHIDQYHITKCDFTNTTTNAETILVTIAKRIKK